MKRHPLIAALESRLAGTTIALGATRIDIDLLPPIYELLREIGHCKRLNVVVYCRGGEVNAARRIALLLHEFTDHLAFVVPYFCESAGTLMALAAREIIAGPLAVFSPIDPHLRSDNHDLATAPGAISAQDVRQFWRLAMDWFDVSEQEAKSSSLARLCESIFPTTLASLYRCSLEVQEIGEDLLSLHMEAPRKSLTEVVDKLIYGYHSHAYALTREDLRNLGLPVHQDPDVDEMAWDLAKIMRLHIAAEFRGVHEGTWKDAILVGGGREIARLRRTDAPGGEWKPIEEA